LPTFSTRSGGSGGAGDTGPVVGFDGTFTAGIVMNYTGDNNSMDHLKVKAGGVAVFKNQNPEYINTIIHEGDGFKTIGSSFELGGLVDGDYPATIEYIIRNYAAFFGLIEAPPTPTPTPTPTSACGDLGVTLRMPSHDFGPGDLCSCTVTV
jgi:hypothetical protein